MCNLMAGLHCFSFRWMNVLEQVSKLELPQEEDEDAANLSNSSSFKAPQLNPTDDAETSALALSVEIEEDIYQNIST